MSLATSSRPIQKTTFIGSSNGTVSSPRRTSPSWGFPDATTALRPSCGVVSDVLKTGCCEGDESDKELTLVDGRVKKTYQDSSTPSYEWLA